MDITTQEVSSAQRDDFYGALWKNDLEKLSQIYSDDYMLVRPDGSAFSYGSVGILTGDSKITTVRDGKESQSAFRLVAVYCKQNDRVELVHFQSSPLPNLGS